MCGIVGVFSNKPVAYSLYESLIHLQHRGQDAAGLLTCDDSFHSKQGLGLVRETFTTHNIQELTGNIGIAHTRYPTAGGYGAAEVQPLWVTDPLNIAIAHNGNLTNYQALADTIRHQQHRHLNTSLDSEALLIMLADSLSQENTDHGDESQFFDSLCRALTFLFARIEGAYSVVSAIIGKGLLAFRDPHGIRPLVLGSRAHQEGVDYMVASETTPFYPLGFQAEGDILPGEVVYVGLSGTLYRRQLKQAPFRPCVFEYVYFARPDATLNNVSVYRARMRMGQLLAKQWQLKHPELIPDVVIPAPFTANTAALSFANTLGLRYSEGLYKNPFIGRTFIMPDQEARNLSIRHKLTPQWTEIQNNVVLIVDDSIVRGTTSLEMVKMVREAGAKKIYLVSTAPPLKYPCFYGIDIPSSAELIAAEMDEEAIGEYLGVDVLLYQSNQDLIEAVSRHAKYQISKPCMACMDGDYCCGQLSPKKMQQLQQERELEKSKEREAQGV